MIDYVYVCFSATGPMDSKKGEIEKIFADEDEARNYANMMVCYVEKWPVYWTANSLGGKKA